MMLVLAGTALLNGATLPGEDCLIRKVSQAFGFDFSNMTARENEKVLLGRFSVKPKKADVRAELQHISERHRDCHLLGDEILHDDLTYVAFYVQCPSGEERKRATYMFHFRFNAKAEITGVSYSFTYSSPLKETPEE